MPPPPSPPSLLAPAARFPAGRTSQASLAVFLSVTCPRPRLRASGGAHGRFGRPGWGLRGGARREGRVGPSARSGRKGSHASEDSNTVDRGLGARAAKGGVGWGPDQGLLGILQLLLRRRNFHLRANAASPRARPPQHPLPPHTPRPCPRQRAHGTLPLSVQARPLPARPVRVPRRRRPRRGGSPGGC